MKIRFTLLTLRQSEGTQMGAFFRAEKERTSALIFAKARIRSSWTNEKRQL